MAVNFFDRELTRLQDRFNSTFGVMQTCDLKVRQSTILSIISLGLLANKINAASSNDEVRDEIAKFVKGRDVLTQFFNQVQQQIERRKHHSQTLQVQTETRKVDVC